MVLADLDVALTLAMQATTQARLELQYAVRNADQADKDAADAQLVLEAVAREMYMRGGDPNLMEVMLSASQSTSLADILNVADYLRSVSDDRVNAALAAYAEADVAHAALADAVEDVARLSEKEDALRKKRDKVASELKAVNAAYENAIIAEVPPQMKVGTDGCPKEVPENTLRDGAETVGAQALCRHAVKQAATPQAALAIKWAFTRLGAAYACGGVGRMLPWRMDCSSYVSRAYFEGAHMPVAGFDWAPSTRNMVPWDGIDLDPHYLEVAPGAIRPGDLVLYDTGGAAYRHVVMYLGEVDGVAYMAHTNACGDVAHVSQFWGFDGSHAVFLVARRVLPAGTDPKTVTAQHPEGKQRVTR